MSTYVPRALLATLILLSICVLPAPDATAHSLLKRGGVDVVHHEESRFSLDVSLGVAGLDGFGSENRAYLTVTPRFDLRTPKGMQTYFTLPVLFIPESYAIAAAPRTGTSSPISTITTVLPASRDPEPEFGSSVFLLPTVEWVRCTETCHRPSLFVGAGVRHDQGRTTQIPVAVDASGNPVSIPQTTDDTTAPALTFGSSLQVVLSPQLTFRWEARVVTTFYDDLDVNTGGVESTLDLDTQLDIFVSVGLQFGF